MKSIKTLLCSVSLLTFSLSSCSDWLNVNIDPEHPSSESTNYQTRLAHIEFYTNSANQFAAWRSSMSMGDWTRNFNGGTYWQMSCWNPIWATKYGPSTTPYQWWFVGAGSNIEDMYKKAVSAGAWHYAGVAKVIRAYGFMLMTDLYGEMPYTEALGQSATPAYDNGKTIYLGCLNELDEGIEHLQKQQDVALPTLAEGDFWNSGNVNKWLKLAYLLKARYCNKLSKKATGSYKEGKYDVEEILACLAKAQQSNADNTIINHTDDNGPTHDVLGWDEPVDYSPLFSVCGMNGGYMVTKMLYDNLTNFAGLGVEDPRADKVIPWAWSQQSAASPANIKFKNGWRRSLGVDMVSNAAPNLTGGPLRADFDLSKGGWWINTQADIRKGDTIYVEATSSSKGYNENVDLLYRRLKDTDASKESGSFYTRVSSPTYVGTYAEACFIKAEVLFKQNDKSGAFTAYRDGIKASIDCMNEKLNKWCADDASLKSCPSFTPMEQADIDNFLANGIGTAGDLTLGKIMTQKRIALHFSVEIWNDMRRYDFNPEIFFGWGVPAYHKISADGLKRIPEGKYYRRWMQCSHEFNYNSKNLQAIGSQVPGANMSSAMWNTEDDAFTINVWWDSDQE
ncbi:SusD/RagB family nutrient-binding outer membrane lipoprotein [Bacteroides heparinolyticus]|uniref:SusD/RagB family nutrient-binding outer membrane lipoprotein n=1 Tax=Prevotella heparinolytica TaxID=28113 RepID=UPI000D045ACC|nr:SusD/RagB family nutrient-binding outer membrane lipoprotein [Bacteroides heparinolyticus]AVM56719.1 SusD/RagB family nutrient-binding outer membrane lipoprotein [Bacteroides heparinolyticus]